jgi:hypothetical protein
MTLDYAIVRLHTIHLIDRYMEKAKRPGRYNATEHAIIAHFNRMTMAHSTGKKPRKSKSQKSSARDLMIRRRPDVDGVTELFGAFNLGYSKLSMTRGEALPFSTNVIQRYAPPRKGDRLAGPDGNPLLPRSEKTFDLFVRLISEYTKEGEQVVIPCTGTMTDAYAGLSINRYPICP